MYTDYNDSVLLKMYSRISQQIPKQILQNFNSAGYNIVIVLLELRSGSDYYGLALGKIGRQVLPGSGHIHAFGPDATDPTTHRDRRLEGPYYLPGSERPLQQQYVQ